jgi:hypothetical protein
MAPDVHSSWLETINKAPLRNEASFSTGVLEEKGVKGMYAYIHTYIGTYR